MQWFRRLRMHLKPPFQPVRFGAAPRMPRIGTAAKPELRFGSALRRLRFLKPLPQIDSEPKQSLHYSEFHFLFVLLRPGNINLKYL